MPRRTRVLPAIVGIFYFASQVVLGSTVETQIWAERRRQIDAREKDRTQLAALPSSPSLSSFVPRSLLNQLPSATGVLQNAPWSRTKSIAATLPRDLRDLADALPLSAVNIQDIWVAKEATLAPIVVIQDVHLNPEAQSNVAVALQELIDRKKAGRIAIEGAFHPLPLAPFRKFSDKAITRTVAQSLLDHAMLAAPSFVGMTSVVEPPPIVGVDDRVQYDANVQAYLDSRGQKATLEKKFIALDQNLSEEKARVFSRELRQFNDLRVAYHKGNLPIGSYVTTLAAEGKGESPVLDRFLEAYRMETSLDFSAVERERTVVVEKLSGALSRDEMKELIDQSLAYRAGRIGFGAYYRGLKDLCARKNISLSQTPAFANYIRYVLLSDGIKADELFEAIETREREVFARLAKTPEEKRLAAQSEWFSLAQKLLAFELTSREWTRYQELKASAPSALPASSLFAFERFYEHADARSERMVRNIFDPIQSASAAPVIFVVGGFHTPRVAELLKQRQRSFIVVSPKISKVDAANGSSYLSVFAQEKTPLDKLFAGQKLFINPETQNLEPGTAARVMANEMARRKLSGLAGLARVTVDVAAFFGESISKTVDLDVYVRDSQDASQDIVALPTKEWFRHAIFNPLWETGAFQKIGYEIFRNLFGRYGFSATSSMWLSMLAVGGLFSLLHLIVKGMNHGWSRQTDAKDFFIRVLLSVGFNLPIAFDRLGEWGSMWASYQLHARYNRFVFFLRLLDGSFPVLGKVGRWLPLASIGHQEISDQEKPDNFPLPKELFDFQNAKLNDRSWNDLTGSWDAIVENLTGLVANHYQVSRADARARLHIHTERETRPVRQEASVTFPLEALKRQLELLRGFYQLVQDLNGRSVGDLNEGLQERLDVYLRLYGLPVSLDPSGTIALSAEVRASLRQNPNSLQKIISNIGELIDDLDSEDTSSGIYRILFREPLFSLDLKSLMAGFLCDVSRDGVERPILAYPDFRNHSLSSVQHARDVLDTYADLRIEKGSKSAPPNVTISLIIPSQLLLPLPGSASHVIASRQLDGWSSDELKTWLKKGVVDDLDALENELRARTTEENEVNSATRVLRAQVRGGLDTLLWSGDYSFAEIVDIADALITNIPRLERGASHLQFTADVMSQLDSFRASLVSQVTDGSIRAEDAAYRVARFNYRHEQFLSREDYRAGAFSSLLLRDLFLSSRVDKLKLIRGIEWLAREEGFFPERLFTALGSGQRTSSIDLNNDHQVSSEVESILTNHHDVGVALFDEENADAVLSYASFLRTVFDFRVFRSPVMPPLAFGLAHGISFPIGGGLSLIPTTESYRRHFLREKGGFSVEIKIPGNMRGKLEIEDWEFWIGREMKEKIHLPNRPVLEQPVAYVPLSRRPSMYGKNPLGEEKTGSFLILRYDRDASRLSNVDFREIYSESERFEKLLEVGRQAIEVAAEALAAGLLAQEDSRTENFRIEFNSNRDPSVTLAGDVLDYQDIATVKSEKDLDDHEALALSRGELEGIINDLMEKIGGYIDVSRRDELKRRWRQAAADLYRVPDLEGHRFVPKSDDANSRATAAPSHIIYLVGHVAIAFSALISAAPRLSNAPGWLQAVVSSPVKLSDWLGRKPKASTFLFFLLLLPEIFGLWWWSHATGPPFLLSDWQPLLDTAAYFHVTPTYLLVAVLFVAAHFIFRVVLFSLGKVKGSSLLSGVFSDLLVLSLYPMFPWIVAGGGHMGIDGMLHAMNEDRRREHAVGDKAKPIDRDEVVSALVKTVVERESYQSNTKPTDLLSSLIGTDPLDLNEVFRVTPPLEQSAFADVVNEADPAFVESVKRAAEGSALTNRFTLSQREALVQGLTLKGMNPNPLGVVKETLFNDGKEVKVVLDGTPESFEKDKSKLNEILGAIGPTNKRIAVRVFIGGTKMAAQDFEKEFGISSQAPVVSLTFEPRPADAVDADGNLHLDKFIRAPGVGESEQEVLQTLEGNLFFIGMSGVARFTLTNATDGKPEPWRGALLNSLKIAFIDDTLRVRALEGAVLAHMDRIARALESGA